MTISVSKESAFTSPSPCFRHSSFTSFTREKVCRKPHRNLVVKVPKKRGAFSIFMVSEANDEGLISWLTTNKAKIDKFLNISSTGSSENTGLRIKENGRPLLKNTEIISLPESVYLSSMTAKEKIKEDVPRISELPGAEDLSPASWLAIQVLHEWGKDFNSIYAPFLRTLPELTDLDSLPLWSDDELAWLTGSPVLKKAQEVKEGVEIEWTQLKDSVLSSIAKDKGDVTLDRYRWAVGVVDALGITVGERILLAPIVMDCSISLNRNAKVEIVSGGFFNTKKTLKLVLTNDLKPGDKIFIDAGTTEIRNTDLLLERGVIFDDEGANSVDMSFTLTTMDPFYDDKIDIIDESCEGGERDGDKTTFSLSPGRRGGWDPPLGMENYLRLLCLGGMDAFLLEAVFRNDVWRFMELPVSADNEEAVCNTIIGACEDALDAYPSVQAESGESGSYRYDMARKLIDGEKGILNAVVTEFKRRKNSLDALEYYQERRLNELDLLRPVDESEIVDSNSGARIGRAFDENY